MSCILKDWIDIYDNYHWKSIAEYCTIFSYFPVWLYLRRGHNTECVDDSVGVLLAQLAEQQRAEAGAGAAAQRVRQLEPYTRPYATEAGDTITYNDVQSSSCFFFKERQRSVHRFETFLCSYLKASISTILNKIPWAIELSSSEHFIWNLYDLGLNFDFSNLYDVLAVKENIVCTFRYEYSKIWSQYSELTKAYSPVT